MGAPPPVPIARQDEVPHFSCYLANSPRRWKPTVGAITEISFQSMPSVWGYFSVRTPAEVHAFADSQFGHIFAHAKTRAAACRLLSLAVSRLRVVGEIHTNVTYVNELIQMDDFLANKARPPLSRCRAVRWG